MEDQDADEQDTEAPATEDQGEGDQPVNDAGMAGPDIQPDSRVDVVLLTEVRLSNPNGDPDLEGRPRTLRSTGQGLITGVATKRRLRDTARIRHGVNLFVEDEALESRIEGLFNGEEPTTKEIDERAWSKFWDVRMFGGTLSAVKIGGEEEDEDGVTGSQITGPWQVDIGRSVDEINVVDLGITRSVQNTEGEQGTMGRQPVVEYGLYRQHMHYSPYASYGDVHKKDLDVLWDALRWMHDHTRASMRPDISWKGVYLIEHDDELGSMPAQEATGQITVDGESEDYDIGVPDKEDEPDGIEITELVGSARGS